MVWFACIREKEKQKAKAPAKQHLNQISYLLPKYCHWLTQMNLTYRCAVLRCTAHPCSRPIHQGEIAAQLRQKKQNLHWFLTGGYQTDINCSKINSDKVLKENISKLETKDFMLNTRYTHFIHWCWQLILCIRTMEPTVKTSEWCIFALAPHLLSSTWRLHFSRWLSAWGWAV